MRLFTRIFLSHLIAVLVACSVLVVAVGFISPEFYDEHIDQVLQREGADDAHLSQELDMGHQQIMLQALAFSLPVSILLAAITAFLATRRITRALAGLVAGSHEIAQGNYRQRLVVSGTDELAELAEHFNDMASALQHTEDERVEMVATVAHELRTPLAALQGYSEALLDGVLPAPEAAHAIGREVGALRRVANDLLLVARVEAGRMELQIAAVTPGEVLADLLDRFTQPFEEKGVQLALDAGSLPTVCADRIRLDQVLGNLLANALRFAPQGSTVTLGAAAADEGLLFWVADEGPGISEEHRPHVFERFYRSDRARSRQDSGIGIGLTVAKGLAEAMGGRISLETGAGRGATFKLWLPTARVQR